MANPSMRKGVHEVAPIKQIQCNVEKSKYFANLHEGQVSKVKVKI
jgi:hypothetical protein